MRLPRDFFLRDVTEVARDLIGVKISVDQQISGLITETEAYNGEGDPASHSFNGIKRRCRSMFAIGGTLYVYRIHQVCCLNTVTGPEGFGAAVLIRGIHVTSGQDLVKTRRRQQQPKNWTNGPGKVAAALALNLDDDGCDLCDESSRLLLETKVLALSKIKIKTTPRIGISKAKERLWRFVLDHAFLEVISPKAALNTSSDRPKKWG